MLLVKRFDHDKTQAAEKRMELEVGAAIGAAYGEKCPFRTALRNGYRDRDWGEAEKKIRGSTRNRPPNEPDALALMSFPKGTRPSYADAPGARLPECPLQLSPSRLLAE